MIPYEGPDDPATFYISKYKITNRLFGEFAASDAGKDVNAEWELGGQAQIGPDGAVYDHPVDLGVEELS